MNENQGKDSIKSKGIIFKLEISDLEIYLRERENGSRDRSTAKMRKKELGREREKLTANEAKNPLMDGEDARLESKVGRGEEGKGETELRGKGRNRAERERVFKVSEEEKECVEGRVRK